SSEDGVNNIDSESVTNEVEMAGVNEVSLDNLENMELIDKENMPNDLLALSVSELDEEEYVDQPFSIELSDVFDSQDSDLAIDDVHFYRVISDEDLDADDVVPVDVGSPLPEEKQHATLATTNADNSVASADVSIVQEQSSFVPEKVDSLMHLSDHNNQTDVTSEAAKLRNSDRIETRQPERLPLTRKVISPNSQEKLCQAMKSTELADDRDLFREGFLLRQSYWMGLAAAFSFCGLWRKFRLLLMDSICMTSNALHNAIMEAGGKDRPPMLAPGSTETKTEMYMENYKNVPQDIRDQLNAEAEAVHIILTGIDNDIYFTIDACFNACEMWKAIERLKQGESINVQDLETNLYWEFRKFTSRDGESLESYYSRFYKMMNEHSQELKTVSYHKHYDILKQHQNKVNEIKAERLARIANPLALVAQQQPVYHPQNHPTHYTQNSSTRPQQAATKNRGKAIVNSPPPIYDQEPTMVTEDDEMSKDKEIDKLVALISLSFKKIYKPTNNNLRTSSNTSRANQDNSSRINRGTGYDNQRIVNVVGDRENIGTLVVQQSRIQCYNYKKYGHVAKECQKPKRAKDAAYHKEEMLLYKREEAGFQLNVEQADWRDDTDDEPDDQELEAHYIYHDVKYASKVEIDCAKAKGDLMSYKMELFAHQKTISIMSQEKAAQIKFYKTRKDKEIDKVIALENKVKVLDNIVYKTGQSVQTINMLNRNCKTSFAKPEFLKKAQRANPRLYDIGCYNDNLALMLASESDEVIRLEKESQSKLSDLIRPFDYENLNNLYDLFFPQREKSSAQRYFSKSNGTAKDLWDALERQMRGSEYGEQDRKAANLYEYETFKAIEGEKLLDTYLHYLLVINDLKKCGYKKDNCDVNDALGYKKKAVVVTSDSLALVAEKIKEINANMVFMAQIKKVLSESDESSSCAEETIAKVFYYTFESESEYEFETSEYYDNSTNYGLFVNNDDDQEIFHDAIESDSENFIENHIDSQKAYDKKKIDEQEILFDKMSRQLVEMNNNMLSLQEKIREKETKISELEGCVSNKDVEIEKCLERLNECENKLHKIGQTNQTIHMIMPSKYTLYNGRKGIGFENPSYFEKAKDLRPSLYDEKVISLGYTPMFLIHSDEALENEKFKRARENKIEFAYDYGNLNASYQTSSLKPYVPNVILEKIIIDLEDEVVSLLEKEKANLKIIESLKGFESSENANSETENQSENDCHVFEKECDKVENSKVISPGMFKLSVSQSVSPISMSKMSCESNNVENLDTFSSVRRPMNSGVI
nr:hypothetical protein [Tanacetum cinerariifolium]